jgi:hypothetical protein
MCPIYCMFIRKQLVDVVSMRYGRLWSERVLPLISRPFVSVDQKERERERERGVREKEREIEKERERERKRGAEREREGAERERVSCYVRERG